MLSDLVTFFPAALLAAVALRPHAAVAGADAGRVQLFALAALLLNPGAVLIDHGHFQYNCISLGAALAGAAMIAAWRRGIAGSVLFCAALGHKQMSLFYAPAFFSHLLGRCLERPGVGRKVRFACERRRGSPGGAERSTAHCARGVLGRRGANTQV